MDYEVIAEGYEFRYAPRGSGLQTETINQLDELTGHNIRKIASRTRPNLDQWQAYYLVWPDRSTVDDVDARVEEHRATDSDFHDSFRTVPQWTSCRNCGSTYQTLVIPPGEPYAGDMALLHRKVREASILRCPSCNASFGQLVVFVCDEKLADVD